MNNIKTDADVLEWARTIEEGKGEKFIPIGKADMYRIAMFVLNYGPLKATLPPTQPEVEEKPPTDAAAPIEDKKSTEKREINPSAAPKSLLGILKAKGINSAQEAFDAFLKDTAKDEKKRRVIDFSTGSMNVGPAFTWWVLGQIEGARCNGL